MPSVAVTDLPSGDSPALALVHPTLEEKYITWKLNGSSWRGRLSLETYLRREEHLQSQEFSRDGGMTFWILVDTTSDVSPRTILASCESFRKRAFVKKPDTPVKEVVSHGIGSVFCRPEFRGKGYARRMVVELGKLLDSWQQKEGERAHFTVLYSDIGKKFYAKAGWEPFPSRHIAFAVGDRQYTTSNGDSLRASPLYADDVAKLCKADEMALEAALAKSHAGSSEIKVALIPDAKTISWHHAREEFVANELLGRTPRIKGAIVNDVEGARVWCIWTRTFGSEQDGNTLNILRLVIEGEIDDRASTEEAASTGPSGEFNRPQILAATAVIQSARREAAKWPMRDIQLWNPTPLTILAAEQVEPSIKIVDREDESIASLRWHGLKSDPGMKLTWIGNEKYGWC